MVLAFAKAQTTKPIPNRAEKTYEKFAFIDSRQILERMADRGYKSVEIFSKLGDTYYFNNDYKNALKWYEELFKLENESIPTEYYFRYAQALKSDRQYAKADLLLKNFKMKRGSLDSRLKNLVNNPDYLDKIDYQKGRFDIESVSINTSYQEFGSAFYGPKQVVFASARDSGVFRKRRHSWNNMPFLDLYVADRAEDGSLTNARTFDDRINSIFHESTPTFSADLNTVYFTRNNYENKDLRRDKNRINNLQIFKSVKVEGEWSEPQIVSFSEDSYSTTHPALTPDGKYLYFASNMPGTMGDDKRFQQTDIWRVAVFENGEFGEAENMSVINTEGRESYPFVSESGNLYFASNGLQSLGGLDIYVSKINKNGSLDRPVNIGESINSVDDDFAFIIDESLKQGYFSSNRNGGTDDNIYKFDQIEDLKEICEQVVSGVITDQITNQILESARITLIDDSNNILVVTNSNAKGRYAIELECDKTYFIRAEKMGYNTAEEIINTPSVKGELVLDIELEPQSVKGGVGDDLAILLNLNPIYFDFDRSFIREDAELELQKVLAVLEDNPTMIIDIRSHTDSRGTEEYNERLSSRRAASTRNYLINKGIDPSRLTSKGYGESELVNECSDGVSCSEEQHQLNRRSEFIITSM
ncbi:outer membrane lipoprotein omp16 precursor [Nonlabens marinus S1-08]|uniref:Outer membrane lipoprotein omp16 n=2 Tax=Nonlabens TaxID=363408 RepID=W8VR33_9FLAO|nr:outer membrane lipoprotein omp16 precursor [Nonlabens marinus S1-08]